MVIFMILYIDDILFIGNDVGLLSLVKIWLPMYFQMKNIGEAQYILRIKVLRDHKNRKLALSQTTYIENFSSNMWYRIPRRVYYSSGMEFLFPKIIILRNLRRKNTC